jgi:preprotein translocase subunit YajC
LTVLSTALFTIAQATQAATSSPTTQATKRPPGFMDLFSSPMFPLLLGIIVLYFFMYRSKRKQERVRKDLLGSMKRGDRVMTAGGILGKIVETEPEKILVKVDENSNTKIWFTRDAIRRVITEEKPEAAK